MGVPQIIVIVLIAIGIGINLSKYGQPKTGTVDIFDVLIGPAITVGLLYWGGFFG